MKAFIIYINNTKSIEYANACLKSFDNYTGWEPELFEGLTPQTLPNFEILYPLKIKEKSRAMDFFKEKDKSSENQKRYYTKKSCSMNHYRLFKKCVELNEPIAIIEHDSICISDWKCIEFDDVLVLNIESALKQEVLKPIHKYTHKFPTGISDIDIKGLEYRHDPKMSNAYIMPGTAAYAITPHGANKMIEVYENIGWEQSDLIINTAYVEIQIIVPELFTFKLPNLRTSHGNIY